MFPALHGREFLHGSPLLRLVLCLRRHVFAALGSRSPRTAGQEFRIETEIYVGEEPKSVSHTVTVFEKAAVYEFIDNPQQIIVYRQGQEGKSGQFILLDTVREPDRRRSRSRRKTHAQDD